MNRSAKKKSTRRRGRPTAEQSQELDEKIKSAALDLFLDLGFDAVTMEGIAREAGITKTTLYARYSDKSELFAAAWRESKDEWSFQDVDSVSPEKTSLESQLLALAEALLEQALSPRVIKLDRMAIAQASNFPEQITQSYSISFSPRIRSVVNVLTRHEAEIENIALKDPEITAEYFLGAITGIAVRLAGMGILRAPAFEKRRIRLIVKLFLKGIQKDKE